MKHIYISAYLYYYALTHVTNTQKGLILGGESTGRPVIKLPPKVQYPLKHYLLFCCTLWGKFKAYSPILTRKNTRVFNNMCAKLYDQIYVIFEGFRISLILLIKGQFDSVMLTLC